MAIQMINKLDCLQETMSFHLNNPHLEKEHIVTQIQEIERADRQMRNYQQVGKETVLQGGITERNGPHHLTGT